MDGNTAFSFVFGMSNILSGGDRVNGERCDVSASGLIFMYFGSGKSEMLLCGFAISGVSDYYLRSAGLLVMKPII